MMKFHTPPRMICFVQAEAECHSSFFVFLFVDSLICLGLLNVLFVFQIIVKQSAKDVFIYA